jgi:hypothetical protein
MVNAKPPTLYRRQGDLVPILQKAGWNPGWKIPPPEFDPCTTQPIANQYTVYVIPAHTCTSCEISTLGIKTLITSKITPKIHVLSPRSRCKPQRRFLLREKEKDKL